MLRKASILLITLALFASMLAGCGDSKDDTKTDTPSAKSITPVKLIPQKANLLGYIDLARISSDQDIAELYNSIPKGEGTEFPQTFEGALGIVGKSLEQCVLFADLSSVSKSDDASSEAENNGYLGIIITGTLDKVGLLKFIESTAGEPLTTTDYKGYQIQSDSSKGVGIVFISEEEMVIGAMQAVKDVLAVQAGEQSAIKGKVRDQYNDLGNALIKLVAAVPAGALGENLDNSESELPVDLSMFKDIETISLAIDKKGQAFPLDLNLCFTSNDSAENIKGLLGSLKEMLGGKAADVPEESKELVSLLKDLKITLNGSCVEISIDLPVTSLSGIAEGIFSLGVFTSSENTIETTVESKDFELNAVQTAVDAYMAVNKLSAITARADASVIASADADAPFKIYLRQLPTKYNYVWDSAGVVTQQP